LFNLAVVGRAILPYWSTHTHTTKYKTKRKQPYKYTTIQHRKLTTITKKPTITSVQIKVLNRYYERIIITIYWKRFSQ